MPHFRVDYIIRCTAVVDAEDSEHAVDLTLDEADLDDHFLGAEVISVDLLEE